MTKKRSPMDRVLEVLHNAQAPLTPGVVCRIANCDDRKRPGEGDLRDAIVARTLAQLEKALAVECFGESYTVARPSYGAAVWRLACTA